jgi:hypothetical protein
MVLVYDAGCSVALSGAEGVEVDDFGRQGLVGAALASAMCGRWVLWWVS